jgi:hypothetical protein
MQACAGPLAAKLALAATVAIAVAMRIFFPWIANI